jgi:hypothetical protein
MSASCHLTKPSTRTLKNENISVENYQMCQRVVREEPLLFCTLVDFQVMNITKPKSHVVGDDEKLQLHCLDTHEIVVLFHGILDLVTVHKPTFMALTSYFPVELPMTLR